MHQLSQYTKEYVIHCGKTRFTKKGSATRYGLWRRLDALSIRWHAPMKYYFYHARFSFYPKSQIRSNRTHRTLYPERKTVYLHCSWRYSRCTGYLPIAIHVDQLFQLNSPNILRYSERFLSTFLSLIFRAMREMHCLMRPCLETKKSSVPAPARKAKKIVCGEIVSVEKLSQIDSAAATIQSGMNMKPATIESLRSYLTLVSA